jgi:putative solute:sodium symporter small subunit
VGRGEAAGLITQSLALHQQNTIGLHFRAWSLGVAGGNLAPLTTPTSTSMKTRVAMSTPEKLAAYWKENLRLLAFCLGIWFIVSYLFGIILVDVLNQVQLGGYPLGFWFAQQGSIYVFVVLIFYYARKMNALDRKYDVHED